jgi:hypothetical protein
MAGRLGVFGAFHGFSFRLRYFRGAWAPFHEQQGQKHAFLVGR